MPRMFIESERAPDSKKEKKKKKNVSIVRKRPRGRVDSLMSLLAFIDICSVAF
jgi:hypothetical protein